MIFDRLANEMHCAAICSICDSIELSMWPYDTVESERICMQCIICDRDIHPEQWRCEDCGEYLGDMTCHQMYMRSTDETIYLCPDHYERRTQ